MTKDKLLGPHAAFVQIALCGSNLCDKRYVVFFDAEMNAIAHVHVSEEVIHSWASQQPDRAIN